MNFEPQKLFIGVIDFFAVLLPGALLTYVLKDDVGPRFLGAGYDELGGTQAGMVFLFSAYLLGHFIFLLGSWLLDDHVYDPIRTATYDGQVGRLAKGEQLPLRLTRLLAHWMLKADADRAVRHAVMLKENYLNPVKASSAINAFQWCKARLTLEHPGALVTVQRFEADSKFFRSLCIVLCVLIPWGLIGNRPAVSLFGAALLPLAFWRYVDQRVKATSQAYWYIITLESQREGGLRHPAQAQADGPSHAGGVVSRRAGDHVEYLLVQAKHAVREWVLPKGHIEPGERMQETAVREVREETGVWARITCEMNDVSFTVDGERVKVQFYLMEAVEEGKPSDGQRKHMWLPIHQALDLASHSESQELLRSADHNHKRSAA